MERLHWLEERVAPTLEAMGFEVVRVALTGSTGRKTLQVMADRRDGSLITVGDCEQISHALSAIFDVEEPVADRYDLEVSSAGIDRPLTRPKDFVAYSGFEAKIETKMSVAGRKRLRGQLAGMTDANEVLIHIDDADVTIAVDNIKTAKLILTDGLIAAATSEQPTESQDV